MAQSEEDVRDELDANLETAINEKFTRIDELIAGIYSNIDGFSTEWRKQAFRTRVDEWRRKQPEAGGGNAKMQQLERMAMLEEKMERASQEGGAGSGSESESATLIVSHFRNKSPAFNVVGIELLDLYIPSKLSENPEFVYKSRKEDAVTFMSRTSDPIEHVMEASDLITGIIAKRTFINHEVVNIDLEGLTDDSISSVIGSILVDRTINRPPRTTVIPWIISHLSTLVQYRYDPQVKGNTIILAYDGMARVYGRTSYFEPAIIVIGVAFNAMPPKKRVLVLDTPPSTPPPPQKRVLALETPPATPPARGYMPSNATAVAALDPGPEFILHVGFRYEADLAGGKLREFASEINPVLHVFVTHGLGVAGADDGVTVIPTAVLDKATSKRKIVAGVHFNPAAAHRGPAFGLNADTATRGLRKEGGQYVLPADASLGFNAYAETATHTGQLCRTRAGEALFLLSEILEVASGTRSAEDVKAVWQVTGDEPLVKGFISLEHVQIEHTQTGSTNYRDFLRFEPVGAAPGMFHAEDKNPKALQLADANNKLCWSELDRSLDVFFAKAGAPLGVSAPKYLQRMHCPFYNTTTGMFPGSIYALTVARRPPPAAFYRKSLAITLDRLDADPNHLLLALAAQEEAPHTTLASTRFVAKVMAETMSVYANAMVYLDDFTNSGGDSYIAKFDSPSPDASARGGVSKVHLFRAAKTAAGKGSDAGGTIRIVEDYKDGANLHGDDCEGLAKIINSTYALFYAVDLSAIDVKQDATFHLLAKMQEVFVHPHVYVPHLMLAGVTNKKLDLSVRTTIAEKDAMAHTFTAFVPTEKFVTALVDTPLTADFAAAVRNCDYVSQYKPQGWHGGMDVLIAEGTARASDLAMPTTSYYATKEEKARAEEITKATLRLQIELMKALPMSVTSVQMPPTHITDERGDVAANRVDAR